MQRKLVANSGFISIAALIGAFALNASIAAAGCVGGFEVGPVDVQAMPGVAASSDAAATVVSSKRPQIGDVLIAGGVGATGQAIGSAQLYSASAGTFVSTPGMGIARAAHQAVMFSAQHEVLVVGGFKGKAKPTVSSIALRFTTQATGKVFHTDKGTFGTFGPVKSKMRSSNSDDDRSFFPAVELQTGLGFLPGGLCNGDLRPTAFTFDSSLNTFQLVANPLLARRAFHTATLLNNGRVLITGGIVDFAGDTTNTAEIFDPILGTFTATGNMINSRAGHTATLLASGKVLITGGATGVASSSSSGTLTALNTTEIFDPTANSGVGAFAAGPTMGAARWEHTATLLGDGSTVLIAGGFNGVASWSLAPFGKLAGDVGSWMPTSGAIGNTAEVFDPTANAGAGGFTPTATSMNAARFGHTATLLATAPNTGDVLIVGGFGGANPGAPLNTVELYSPLSGGSFTPTTSLKAARAWHTATLIQ